MQHRKPTSTVPRHTRRTFLSQCSTLALGAAMGPAVASSLAASPRQDPADPLRLATFAKQVGSEFAARHEGAWVRLVLTEACATCGQGASSATVPDAANEKFSLCFRATRGPRLEQDTYEFEHPEMGRFMMFIVPMRGLSTDALCYEAIFNRRTTLSS